MYRVVRGSEKNLTVLTAKPGFAETQRILRGAQVPRVAI